MNPYLLLLDCHDDFKLNLPGFTQRIFGFIPDLLNLVWSLAVYLSEDETARNTY